MWAHWGYAVGTVVAWGILAVDLAATNRHSAERWGGLAAFAVLWGLVLLFNVRALRRGRGVRDGRRS
jgi:hypothetical protein